MHTLTPMLNRPKHINTHTRNTERLKHTHQHKCHSQHNTNTDTRTHAKPKGSTYNYNYDTHLLSTCMVVLSVSNPMILSVLHLKTSPLLASVIVMLETLPFVG